MAERFFVPNIGPDPRVALTGNQAHHLARVCRGQVGDRVRLFDGSGSEFEAFVAELGREEVQLCIVARHSVDRELPFPLTLACPAPKAGRVRWLVEKATELGVSRFVLLVTERASPSARNVRAAKLRRWVIEASKQCGRNVLMELSGPIAWQPYLESLSDAPLRIIVDPSGQPWDRPVCQRAAEGAALAVGPEGGFTDAELAMALQRGWIPLSLGPRTLRIETAALAAVAVVTAIAQKGSDSADLAP